MSYQTLTYQSYQRAICTGKRCACQYWTQFAMTQCVNSVLLKQYLINISVAGMGGLFLLTGWVVREVFPTHFQL